MHTQRHTHTTLRHTCRISTQEAWQQPGTGAWLGGAEEGLFLETKALHTHTKEKNREKKRKMNKKFQENHDIHESKKKEWST